MVDYTKCDLKAGNILVCCDSLTDVPMLEYCLSINPQGVFTVWVTINEELRFTVKFFKFKLFKIYFSKSIFKQLNSPTWGLFRWAAILQ